MGASPGSTHDPLQPAAPETAPCRPPAGTLREATNARAALRATRSIPALLDYFVPRTGHFLNPDERRRGKLIVTISFFALLLGPAYLLLYGLESLTRSAFAIAAATLWIGATPFLVRATRSAAPAGNSIAAALFGVIAVMAEETGGLHAPALIWVATLPIAGFSLVGRRAGIFWSSVGLALTTMFFAAHLFGYDDHGAIYMEGAAAFEFAAIAGLVAVVILFAVAFEAQKDRTLSALSLANDYLSRYDTLTGLPNRALFGDVLERSIRDAAGGGHPVGLLYIGVDRFKELNRTVGADGGDRVLLELSARLRQNVRASDIIALKSQPVHTTLARLGGDEFSILLPRLAHEDDAGKVAKRVLEATSEPFIVDGVPVALHCSVGIALFPTDTDDPRTLLQCADSAMSQAKSDGGSRCAFYSPALSRRLQRKLQLEQGLREALEGDRLRFFYQPLVDLETGAITGAESLARWNDESLGAVSPAEFIPLAEETDLIETITQKSLADACTQARCWREAGHFSMKVSVNFSPSQFRDTDVFRRVTESLQSVDLDPSALQIEITEGLMLEQDEATLEVLRSLRSLGVEIALDDFGTGYSSLSYLTRLPLDVLKIDRCFIREIGVDPKVEGIVRTVISMAHDLGMRVVAEGVEEEGQRAFLREHACDQFQGFLFSPAVPAHAFSLLLPECLAPAPARKPALEAEVA